MPASRMVDSNFVTQNLIVWHVPMYELVRPKKENIVNPKYCSRREIMNMNAYSSPIQATTISVFRS